MLGDYLLLNEIFARLIATIEIDSAHKRLNSVTTDVGIMAR